MPSFKPLPMLPPLRRLDSTFALHIGHWAIAIGCKVVNINKISNTDLRRKYFIFFELIHKIREFIDWAKLFCDFYIN